jgi:hypothetical protein
MKIIDIYTHVCYKPASKNKKRGLMMKKVYKNLLVGATSILGFGVLCTPGCSKFNEKQDRKLNWATNNIPLEKDIDGGMEDFIAGYVHEATYWEPEFFVNKECLGYVGGALLIGLGAIAAARYIRD